MNTKLAIQILTVTLIPLISLAWSNADLHTPKKQTIRFKQLTSTIKNDTSAVIHVIIDNGEREREFEVLCTAWPDSFVIRAVIPAWYYNYTKTFTATIPLK